MQKHETAELIPLSAEELTATTGRGGCRRICHPVYRHGRAIGVRCFKQCW